MTAGSLRVEDRRLHWGEASAFLDDVSGLEVRHSGWTGRTWLHVRGPGWWIPVEAGYGALRQSLRRALPRMPVEAAWRDGRLPPSPAGLPERWVGLGLLISSGLAVFGATVHSGPIAGLLATALGSWAFLRSRARVVVRPEGVRAGSVWDPLIPWYAVESTHLEQVGRVATLIVISREGAHRAPVPVPLVPVVRARLRRLGGLELTERTSALDVRYARWRRGADSIAWGLGLAAVSGAWWTPIPWTWLSVGLLGSAMAALVAEAIEARSTGWGSGGILWITLAYGLLLALIGLIARGWLPF